MARARPCLPPWSVACMYVYVCVCACVDESSAAQLSVSSGRGGIPRASGPGAPEGCGVPKASSRGGPARLDDGRCCCCMVQVEGCGWVR